MQSKKTDGSPLPSTTKKTKSNVKLTSYTIKAVIPTGPYANVQPEIVVSAPSLKEAQDYVLPHIDSLFEKYLNLSDRPKPKVAVKETPAPKEEKPTAATFDFSKAKPAPVAPPTPTVEPEPIAGPFEKAKAAITSCKSVEALNLILTKIEASVKLDALDKADLQTFANEKRTELLTPNAS